MDSPFLDRLNTNYNATTREIHQIRQIISEALLERSRIDDEIEKLRLRQKEIDEYVSGHRTIVSPFRRLPVELIQRVFVHTLPPHNSVMSAKEAPMLLGRVCSSWRHMSLSTPLLWSSLHLRVPVNLRRDVSLQTRYGDAVAAWLSRSGDLPLSISFVEGGDDRDGWFDYRYKERTERPSYLLNVLLGFSSRWKHLNFKLIHRYQKTFSRLSETDTPLLETVALEVTCCVESFVGPHSLSFLGTPSLKSLSIDHSELSTPSALPVRWENLTKIHFAQNTRLKEAMIILRKCSRLVACALALEFDGLVPNGVLEHAVYLPYLETLRVIAVPDLNLLASDPVTYSENAARFLEAIHSPKLRHLHFSTGDRVLSHTVITSFLERQKVDIHSLSFIVGRDQTASLLANLESVPSIQLLHIDGKPSYDNSWDVYEVLPPILNEVFFAQITPTVSASSQRYLLPYLKDVDFRLQNSSEVTDETILRFILARTSGAPDGVSCLRRAHFTFGRVQGIDILPRLQSVIEEGLEIRLTYEANIDDNPPRAPFDPCSDMEFAENRDEWMPGF
ncbi:hypothetical protein D9615_009121 [Tricholomella constricta]|uniref:F-box domain-containing protein n=1 Tax=Tricholomella constricta TaxID=117010 RepID=A0A8H5LYQ4_9AGAR|nr:hypothetical protein D9615_009121 [Tricholomella constricta]